jgi:hypothetical protein
MPTVQGDHRFDECVRRWSMLAERRVAYYSELYSSGRWTHYFRSRQEFAARMLEVIHVAKVFAAQCGHRLPDHLDAPVKAASDDLRPAA